MELIAILGLGYFFFLLVSKHANTSPVLKLFATLFTTFATLFNGLFSLLFRGLQKKTYGTAKFVSPTFAKYISRYNDGVSLDGKRFISKEDSCEHALVAAVSGAGKTSNIIIPSIENISRHQSGCMVVTDPSNEIANACSDMLRHRGYTILKLDVSNPSDSQTFNPLIFCNSSSEIHNISKILIESAMGSGGKDPFWNLSAISLLSILIKIIKVSLPPEQHTLSTLKNWVNIIGISDLRTDIDNYASTNLSTEEFNQYLAIMQQNQKLLTSIIAVCTATMTNVNSNVEAVTNTNTIDFNKLRTEKTIIFVSVAEQDQKQYAFILSIFYQILLDKLYIMPNDDDNYVFLLLDEFANLDLSAANIPTAITVLRKRRVSLTLIIQSLSQLQERYNREWETIFGNCRAKVFFGGMDYNSCNQISRTIGYTTYITKDNPFNVFEKGRETSRLLIQPEELRRLPKNRILLLFGAEQAMKLNALPFFKNKRLLAELKR